ncbi:MAG TPA: rhomboid family intramembrane serine protease [Acidimicrobiales bacterium]|nr:rhomboid family intramembrane serine protease [Acidimicrobiales bacterium]
MIQASVGWQCPECVHQGARQSREIRPFANRNRTGIVGSTNPTPMVIALIAVNVACFVASGFGSSSALTRFALQPIDVHTVHQYYRLVTAMFLHANLLHIASNMFTLLIVGPAVEVILGRTRFLVLYLIAGLGGSVCSYLLSPAAELGVGASGAIMGLMGAYVVLALRQRRPMGPVVALLVLNLAIGFTGAIDWRAHIGGMVVGGLTALAYDSADGMRQVASRIALAVGANVVTVALLGGLVLAIGPGHVNFN